MRFRVLFLATFSIFCTVVALPISNNGVRSLSKINDKIDVKGAPLLHSSGAEAADPVEREFVQFFRRRGQKSRRPGPRPGPPIITFGKEARKDLDKLGLHGKERKRAKNYHKKIIKDHMRSIPGAYTADVARIAHLGGTTPNDPLHATVAYRKKAPAGLSLSKTQLKKLLIPSTYTDSTGAIKKGGLHHVYPTQGLHRLPKSYAIAERARAGLSPGAPIPHKL